MNKVQNEETVSVTFNTAETNTSSTVWSDIAMINAKIDRGRRVRDHARGLCNVPVDVLNETMGWITTSKEREAVEEVGCGVAILKSIASYTEVDQGYEEGGESEGKHYAMIDRTTKKR